jgi:hypothetical protein
MPPLFGFRIQNLGGVSVGLERRLVGSELMGSTLRAKVGAERGVD